MAKSNGLKLKNRLMLEKYGHVSNLVCNDVFWTDVYNVYYDCLLPLPLLPTVANFRLACEAYTCLPGECASCCDYGFIELTVDDVARILRAPGVGQRTLDRATTLDAKNKIGLVGPCAFLQDNICTIYNYRPTICYTFPFQIVDGAHLLVRIRCRQALEATRVLIKYAKRTGIISAMLPDFRYVFSKQNGGNKSES